MLVASRNLLKGDPMKRQRANRKPRIKLDPRLIQISAEEIRADLLYPAGARRRERRP
jgi:hypothetical protein